MSQYALGMESIPVFQQSADSLCVLAGSCLDVQEPADQLYLLWRTGPHLQTILPAEVDVRLPADVAASGQRRPVLLEVSALLHDPAGTPLYPGQDLIQRLAQRSDDFNPHIRMDVYGELGAFFKP